MYWIQYISAALASFIANFQAIFSLWKHTVRVTYVVALQAIHLRVSDIAMGAWPG